MKTFRIGVFEEKGGYITIKANNKEKAKMKAQNYIDDNGLDESVDITHRDTQVFNDIKEVK